eukprot:GCRY01002400.1.p1 GENE.GCRY01002400.1~~GCRY01002400.1.p1  ORF type:complete len:269 (-),score=67.29 GCRY01002400.1:820-1626(-)
MDEKPEKIKFSEGTTCAIVFSSSYGHTKVLASFVGQHLEEKHQMKVQIFDIKDKETRSLDLDPFDSLILMAPLITERYAANLKRLMKKNADFCASKPAAFLANNLSWARGKPYEDVYAEMTPKQREFNENHLPSTLKYAEEFMAACNMAQGHLLRVLGDLPYLTYNIAVRQVMKMISKKNGFSTDTSRNHDYTDYEMLRRDLDGLFGGGTPEGPADEVKSGGSDGEKGEEEKGQKGGEEEEVEKGEEKEEEEKEGEKEEETEKGEKES